VAESKIRINEKPKIKKERENDKTKMFKIIPSINLIGVVPIKRKSKIFLKIYFIFIF
jgi:hypothetical protein